MSFLDTVRGLFGRAKDTATPAAEKAMDVAGDAASKAKEVADKAAAKAREMTSGSDDSDASGDDDAGPAEGEETTE